MSVIVTTGSQTLEQAIVAALTAGDEARAAQLLRVAFGRDPERGTHDLPELLEELAEYFASVDRVEDAVAAAARAVLMTVADAPDEEALRRRCRIAEVLLRAGLPDEACAVYAAVSEDAPTQTWVHEAAGCDYLDAGEAELAHAWLTAGLEQALADGEVECVVRLLDLRRSAAIELGWPRDGLDRRAEAVAADYRPTHR